MILRSPLTGAGLLVATLLPLACRSDPGDGPARQPPGTPGTVVSTTPAPVTEALTVDLVALDLHVEPGGRVRGLDWDGRGRAEVAVADHERLRVVRIRRSGALEELWSTEAAASPTALDTGDLDGDGKDDVVLGWGEGFAHRDAKAQLVAYLSKDAGGGRRAEPIAAPETTRAQFTTVTLTRYGKDLGVLWAAFVSKYETVARFSTRSGDGKWKTREIARVRLGTHWAVTGPKHDILIVGRPYGDDRRTFGDVRQWRPGAAPVPIPSVRGVRSLATVRLGPRDAPRELVCYGAGWHWEYKAQAKGILTCAERQDSGKWATQTVDELGSYEVGEIRAADVEGDGVVDLVAQGPDGIFSYSPTFGDTLSDTSWKKRTLGPTGYDLTAIDPDGDGTDELVVLSSNGATKRDDLAILPRLIRARK